MNQLINRIKTYAGVLPASLTIGIFLMIPLGIVLVFSFLQPGDYGSVKPVFSTEAYTRLLFQRDLFDQLGFDSAYLIIGLRSLTVAVVSVVGCWLLVVGCWLLVVGCWLLVVGCLALGFPVAYYIAQCAPSRRNLLLLLITIPFWTNLLIRTYCWILVLRDNGLINNTLMELGLIDEPLTLLYTDGAIALGLVYTYVPFMVLPIYASLERLDPRLFEASRDLYADRWTTLRKLALPLAKPGIVAGSILVFIPALGSFIAPDLLGGGKKLMLGSLVHLQFSSARNWPFGSAIAMVIMAIVLLSLLFFARNQRKSGGGGLHGTH